MKTKMIFIIVFISPYMIVASEKKTPQIYNGVEFIFKNEGFPEKFPGYLKTIKKELSFIEHEIIHKARPIIDAVKEQNHDTSLTREEIQRRDISWKSGSKASPIRISIEKARVTQYLKNIIQKKKELAYSEIFLTDKQGANVAAYPLTSDYWQGDEEKFTLAYQDGKTCRIFVGDFEYYDESADSKSVQISVPVYENKFGKGECIGVMIIGIRHRYLKSQNRE
ncbi:MAG: hypothetical protein H6618_09040 [Deltaproteobacteria bacterium]|nr:hypothetical protein [Deltaproteobacteria bacterium]